MSGYYRTEIEAMLDEMDADRYERSAALMKLRVWGFKNAKRFLKNCRPETTPPKQQSILDLTKEASA